jgi:nucleotide sugar dehydrogenase
MKDLSRSAADYHVAVVGLGKIGLSLAAQYASHGAKVTGCDINPAVVDAINRGETPVGGEDQLEEVVRKAHAQGRLCATTDTAKGVSRGNVVVVIVPLMVSESHEIDFRIIDSATAAVAEGLQPGTLVIYETTLPVGTTGGRLRAILEEGSGLKAGKDFFLAFSPERVRTGRIFSDLAKYPKVVGGVDPQSTCRAEAFYRAMVSADVMVLSSAEAAELCKLIETTYRDVNIALANEFAVYAQTRGLNVYEAIAAANSQQQSHVHEPGVGVGGHCIPVYPYFLINDGQPDELWLPRWSRELNDTMACHAADMVEEVLGMLECKDVLILGLSYRAGVKESAYSSALRLLDEFYRRGARVFMHDPLFTKEEVEKTGAIWLDPWQADGVDAVVVQAYHEEYRSLPKEFLQKAKALLDGRGDLDPSELGLTDTTYLRVGVPPVEGGERVAAQIHSGALF